MTLSVEDWAALKKTHPYEFICSCGNTRRTPLRVSGFQLLNHRVQVSKSAVSLSHGTDETPGDQPNSTMTRFARVASRRLSTPRIRRQRLDALEVPRIEGHRHKRLRVFGFCAAKIALIPLVQSFELLYFSASAGIAGGSVGIQQQHCPMMVTL
jgi:hypothetical protein